MTSCREERESTETGPRPASSGRPGRFPYHRPVPRPSRPDPRLFVALLAGGRGTRFWPLSRHSRPKQFLDVTGDGPLLAVTRERVRGLCPPENVLVVTTADLAEPTRRMLDLPHGNVIAEPSGRNTAPAVGLAALVALARRPDAVVLALPADHHVRRPRDLARLLRRGAAAAAATKGVVLFGAVPDRPETAYGYLVPGEGARAPGAPGLLRVARFREKPDAAGARRLLRQGALWNTGLFALHAQGALAEIGVTLPALHEQLLALAPHVGAPSFKTALQRLHPLMPAVSFDHGVLERSRRVFALRADVGWSDVGSWESLAELLADDGRGNRTRGRAIVEAARGCIVVQGGDAGRALVVLGVDDLVLVDAGDVVLACPRGRARDVKALMTRLAKHHPELL